MLGKQPARNINEQFYIDARLDFAIKHPLDWKLKQIPVSSPDFRADTVRWQVNGLKQGNDAVGEMLIRSWPTESNTPLEDLLNSYLSGEAKLADIHKENFDHPSGPALKLTGHDDQQGRLLLALKGQKRDFIISIGYPSNRFEELLPVFQDIIDSFVEVVRPDPPA